MLVLCDFWVLHTHDAQREAQLNKMIYVSFISHIAIHTHTTWDFIHDETKSLMLSHSWYWCPGGALSW